MQAVFLVDQMGRLRAGRDGGEATFPWQMGGLEDLGATDAIHSLLMQN